MIDHDDARLQLADLVVPGLADPTRTAALRAHVAVCAECQSELDDLRYVDDLVRAGGPLPEPSEALEARIREITGPAATGTAPRLRRRFESITTWRIAAAGLAATTVALAAALIAGNDDGNTFQPNATRAMETAEPWAGATGSVATGTLGGSPALQVKIANVQPPAPGATYEVWVANDPKARISLGTIQPDASGSATVTLPIPAAAADYRRVWVTNEPADGDPKWTSDWIVKTA